MNAKLLKRTIVPLALCYASNCAYAENDDIVVKLTQESKLLLSERLKAMRLGELQLDSVVVSRKASSSFMSELSTHYGNRVAFRMKGYVNTKCRKSKNCTVKYAVSY